MQHSFRIRLASMIGNVLEHYDNALFSLLAPFIAPLFFNQYEPLTALIMTYAMLPLGIVTRPLGALFFGWLGDSVGRRHALFATLVGMAIVTFAIGCLPTFKQAGLWSPLLLASGRMLQNFFAAGESTGASIFLLENTERSKRTLMGSIYSVSSMIGIILASGLVTLLAMGSMVEAYWRILFWLGSFTGLIGVWLRFKTAESNEFIHQKKEKMQLFHVLNHHKTILLSIVIVAGFSYTTYAFAFSLMNGFLPLVTAFTKTAVMKMNTGLLVMDMLLLPLFGLLASRIGKEKLMLCASAGAAISSLPIFYFLSNAHWITIISARFLIVVCGTAFAAPYHAWALEKVEPKHRYTILALGSSLGAQLIGAPTTAVCLWLYQKLGWVSAPGIYFLVIAGAASCAVYALSRKEQALSSQDH